MKIVGREKAIKELEYALHSRIPELIVLYGRKGVGKTYLIKEFFNNKFSFYTSGLNNESKSYQLKNFQNALKEYGSKEKEEVKDWLDAFSLLKKLLESDSVYRDPKTKKRIIFLDELPWIYTPRSDFKAALDLFWNTYASSQNDIILIVCGSATSWILKNMVKDEGGFYNRLTRKIHLLPFSLKECMDLSNFLKLKYNKNQVAECYMVFGGIPYYWSLLKKEFSIPQNIDYLIFDESGTLHDEYQALFKSLFSSKGKHREVIEALIKKKSGMRRKELAKIKNIGDGKSLTTTLEELEECGFIREFDNYKTSINNKFYQVIDPLVLFANSFLINKEFDSWMSFINTPTYYSWSGHAFEILCLNNIDSIKKALGISGVSTKIYSWRSKTSDKGAQIDLLIHRKDMVINVCEMKFSVGEFTITKEYEDNLRNKLEAFIQEVKPKEQLRLTLISFNGLKHNEHSGIIVSEVASSELF